MTVHEFYIDEVEWSSYLLKLKSDIILSPDDELLINDFLVLIAIDLRTGKSKDKIIIKQVFEIDKKYEVAGGRNYWKLFLIEPKNGLEVLADRLIEKARSNPV